MCNLQIGTYTKHKIYADTIGIRCAYGWTGPRMDLDAEPTSAYSAHLVSFVCDFRPDLEAPSHFAKQSPLF